MPPFQVEVDEKRSKRLPFLSRNESVPKTPSVLRVFAAEPAELGSHTSSSWRPSPSPVVATGAGVQSLFQDEGEEGDHERVQKKTRLATIFGPESHEHEKASSSTVFGMESAESPDDVYPDSNDDEPGSEGDFVPKADSVFALGWSSLSAFQKATYWKQHVDDPKTQRRKRKYDNRKRQSQAAYARSSGDVYKKNGVDPGRLQKLFDSSSCQCSSNALVPYSNAQKVLYDSHYRFFIVTHQSKTIICEPSPAQVPTRSATVCSKAPRIFRPSWRNSGTWKSRTKMHWYLNHQSLKQILTFIWGRLGCISLFHMKVYRSYSIVLESGLWSLQLSSNKQIVVVISLSPCNFRQDAHSDDPAWLGACGMQTSRQVCRLQMLSLSARCGALENLKVFSWGT